MHSTILILTNLLLVAGLMLVGFGLRRYRLVSSTCEQDLSRLLIDVFWPCLVFVSLAANYSLSSIGDNLILPLLGAGSGLVGGLIGLLCIVVLGFSKDSRGLFLYNCFVNNFIFMALPFAASMIPNGKGESMLLLASVGAILVMWTLGVGALRGSSDPRELVRGLATPGLAATGIALLAIVTGINRAIPPVVYDALTILGKPTVAIAMIVAGMQMQKLGRSAIKLDTWNVSLAIVRLAIIPAVLLGIAVVLQQWVEHDILMIFMIMGVMPVSINSISLAMRYTSRPDLAAQAVALTHIGSIPSIVVFLSLSEALL